MHVLMLGKGWFPSQLGGLDRYFRGLLEQLPNAHGVVVGPARGAGPSVTAASTHDAQLWLRLLAFTRAAAQQGKAADLIDSHFALYALPTVLIGGLRRKPLIVHFHGPWAEENASAGDVSRWRHYARWRLERAVYSRAQLVITLTGAFRRTLVEDYGVSPWSTAVLAPGVDLGHFTPGDRSDARARLGLAPDAFVACCVRRLVPRMGLDVLIEAWAQTLAANPDARLLIAGEGGLRGDLEQQIRALSLNDSVRLLGRISDEELLATYRAADVNVVPTIAFEGFGMVVLEAAACGTPSIVTRVGGLPEAVAGLGRDLIVPPLDAEALATRLLHGKQGRLPSREQTRSWAATHGWDRVAAAHREPFARVVSDHRASTRKLRVIYLDHVAQLSGGELALLRLLQAQTEIESHVILAEEGPLVDRLLEAGISVEVLPLPQRTRHLRKDSVRFGLLPLGVVLDTLVYTLRTAWRLRRLRPDVVHTNSLKSGIYGSIAARLTRTPVVWHLRDRIDVDYLPPLGVRLIRSLTRQLPNVVISNSDATMSTVRPRGSSVVIWSVVSDMAAVDASDSPEETAMRPLVVGMVGRLAPWKGQDVFLRAFAQAFPEGDQRAIIVGAPLFGAAEVAYAERLCRLVEELDIASRVEFRGHREDVGEELQAMDVLVHASTIPEPFGQVIIEGMSAQLPVLASRGGGPEQIITDGVDGLLYRRGDANALAALLRRLDEEPELRTQLARAARRRAQDFSPAAVASQILDAYELALRGGHTRP
jgi:glycosyltransferase involved in cell wall biosynthesis